MEESGGDDSDIDQIKNKSRKKLRLSKEQSDMLEDSFKLHTSLNPKLKQTEEECEILKKCCETLKDENQRLKKEVEELRSMKLKVLEASSSSSSSSILCNIIQLSNLTTLAMCSSCHKPIISTNNNNIGDDDHISEFVVPQIAE
ncbi:homeobox-leucine zipper protein HAT14-like [Senna tora]|uniref:Homeobox-leucine zipper protein HAT14-like n=1 Tax=Senna tora TaxID=362788 RepID=A0A834SP26_9FABA|nr:homeobox-leucine zipper protein HAT14-like [Senna tora]